jgi:hypothetical protein
MARSVPRPVTEGPERAVGVVVSFMMVRPVRGSTVCVGVARGWYGSKKPRRPVKERWLAPSISTKYFSPVGELSYGVLRQAGSSPLAGP